MKVRFEMEISKEKYLDKFGCIYKLHTWARTFAFTILKNPAVALLGAEHERIVRPLQVRDKLVSYYV